MRNVGVLLLLLVGCHETYRPACRVEAGRAPVLQGDWSLRQAVDGEVIAQRWSPTVPGLAEVAHLQTDGGVFFRQTLFGSDVGFEPPFVELPAGTAVAFANSATEPDGGTVVAFHWQLKQEDGGSFEAELLRIPGEGVASAFSGVQSANRLGSNALVRYDANATDLGMLLVEPTGAVRGRLPAGGFDPFSVQVRVDAVWLAPRLLDEDLAPLAELTLPDEFAAVDFTARPPTVCAAWAENSVLRSQCSERDSWLGAPARVTTAQAVVAIARAVDGVALVLLDDSTQPDAGAVMSMFFARVRGAGHKRGPDVQLEGLSAGRTTPLLVEAPPGSDHFFWYEATPTQVLRTGVQCE